MSAILSEGKTKIIRRGERPGEVVLETKDELTGGDAAKRETISGIAVWKTTQARNVFRLLQSEGIDTAYLRPGGDRAMVCSECSMLPLELVTRRYAWGSILNREPWIESTREKPHRFAELRREIFHKNAVVMPPLQSKPVQMDEGKARELYLRSGKWADGVYTDPLMRIGDDGRWMLYPAKGRLDQTPPLTDTPALLDAEELRYLEERLMAPTFAALERAWGRIETANGPVALVDLKMEVGRRASDGKLVVADVIDNDSWRIWPGGDPSRQLDKQVFREGHPLAEVAENYELVAALTERFLS
ncbi:MAG TPA: phosphoribosylaminoimidazolesuccinocarboxamide synthase [Thermoanaerobaculia bacterium]|jgi:phosphoribosylaminoimidazole-succinocarboxamide synthase|nr:phosphoribosylaminoimidazolesuccinocarboxamide synthase [Thermoanaerobaculia bacterium]